MYSITPANQVVNAKIVIFLLFEPNRNFCLTLPPSELCCGNYDRGGAAWESRENLILERT